MNNSIARTKSKYLTVGIMATLFFLLLLLRDGFRVDINKYLFVSLAFMPILLWDINRVLCFMFFLMPLYVGLPGNYLTLLFLIRILLEYKQIKLSVPGLLSAVFISIFILIQNIFTGYTSINNMMLIPSLFLVLFIFSYRERTDSHMLITMYSLGVAATGIIMLISALHVYSLSDLLSTSFRLGSVEYVEEGRMNVSIDPNYYGTFSIAAIAVGMSLIQDGTVDKVKKILLVFSITTSIIVGLIGLSRAFVIVLLLWVFLYLLSQRKFKYIITFMVIFMLVFVLVKILVPNVMEAVLNRFSERNLASGNERIDLIISFYYQWKYNIFYFLFGVGMFVCNVHCMPLQYLFGGGVVLAFLMLVFAFSLINSRKAIAPLSRKRLIPVVVTLIMSLTVPIATSLTFMFPVIFSIYCLHAWEKSYSETEHYCANL